MWHLKELHYFHTVVKGPSATGLGEHITDDLALFFLCVKTNVGYSVVNEFINMLSKSVRHLEF